MAARPTKQVAVTDEVYNEWLQEVKALKPRKQKSAAKELAEVATQPERRENPRLLQRRDWRLRELLPSTRGSAVQEAVSDMGSSRSIVPLAEGGVPRFSGRPRLRCERRGRRGNTQGGDAGQPHGQPLPQPFHQGPYCAG